MNSTVPTAHIKHAIKMPIGMIAVLLATAGLLPVAECCAAFVNSDPQYHKATT